MAPRASWKGYLKLALVTCPVALYAASSTSDRVALHTLNRATGHRVKRIFVDEETDEPVDAADQVKGYEIDKDEYVVLSKEEIEAAIPQSTKTIEIEAFVPPAEVDDLYLDTPYYLAPSAPSARMPSRSSATPCRPHSRRHRPRRVVPPRPRPASARGWAGLRRVDPAFRLRGARSRQRLRRHRRVRHCRRNARPRPPHHRNQARRFDPAKLHDRYEEALVELIRAKQQGRAIAAKPTPKTANVIDLMDALRKSAAAGEPKVKPDDGQAKDKAAVEAGAKGQEKATKGATKSASKSATARAPRRCRARRRPPRPKPLPAAACGRRARRRRRRRGARRGDPPWPQPCRPIAASAISAVTAEPKGRKRAKAGHAFVIQMHAARRLHYDLRLELDGVFKSWAITKGPSLVAGDKRLAVHVEDHPLDYGDFEGTIPKGEYGGGSVIVWDRGTWTPIGDPHKGYAKGHLEFELDGHKLGGRWHLVRMRGKPRDKNENWLLIKGEDSAARPPGAPDILTEQPLSVISGRSIAEVDGAAKANAAGKRRSTAAPAAKPATPAKGASPPREPAGSRPLPRWPRSGRRRPPGENTGGRPEGGKPDWRPRSGQPGIDVAGIEGVKRGPMPSFVEPCLATLQAKAPTGRNWLHEIKFDGYRLQAHLVRGTVALKTRNGHDWTAKFGKPVVAALARLPAERAIIDGELVVENDSGASGISPPSRPT